MTISPAIRLKTSHTHVGLKPGLLTSGTSRHAKIFSSELSDISSLHTFFTISANVFLRSVPQSP